MSQTSLPAEIFSPTHRRGGRWRTLLGLAVAACIGGMVLTHHIAHHYGYATVLGAPWRVPTLPRIVYLTGVALAVAAVVMLARRPGLRPLALLTLPLGSLFGALFFGPAYPPWQGLGWLPRLLLSSATRPVAVEAATMALAAALVTGALAAWLLRRPGRPAEVAAVAHGSARLATTADLRRAGWLGTKRGIRLGGWPTRLGLRPLADDSEAHVLAVMPTGAGKTSGLILPTLLTDLSPAFVLDPKGELWQRSAGWRAKNRRLRHRCLRFSPTGGPGETLAWNPFDEVRRGPREMNDLRILAENLVTTPAYLGHNHWTRSAQRLFQLLALHLMWERQANPTFARLRSLLNDPARGHQELFKQLLTYKHDRHRRQSWKTPSGETTATHPEVAVLARSFLNTPDRELGSIVSTLQPFLAPWADPQVAASTARSDFSLAEFLHPTPPVTLYVALPYQDLEALGPVLRLMLALLIRRLTDDAETETRRGRILFLLDELAALGRVPILEEMLSFFRGYRIRAALVVQDLGHLTKLYSAHETLSGNCRIHLAAATQSAKTRQHVSQLAGEATVRYRHRSLSGGRGSLFLKNAAYADAEARRPLIAPAEVGHLPQDRHLILATGLPPVLARRMPYFEDVRLAERAREEPPELAEYQRTPPAHEAAPELDSAPPTIPPPPEDPDRPRERTPQLELLDLHNRAHFFGGDDRGEDDDR